MENINQDIQFVQSILPNHYEVKESKTKGSIHCKSSIGIKQNADDEDDEQWSYILTAIKNHFSTRFQEVYHNTCTFHVDFTIHLKVNKHEPFTPPVGMKGLY
jgi:hypothetical protein